MLHAITKPMLNNFTPRLYQETIFGTAAQKNALVVLPTGMGKCLTKDEPILLESGELIPIGELIEQELQKSNPCINTPNHKAVVPSKQLRVMALDDEMQWKAVNIIGYHKINADKTITLRSESGASLAVTPEHPMLVWRANGPSWVRADSVKEGERVACPKHIKTSPVSRELDLRKIFKNDMRRTVNVSIKNQISTLDEISTKKDNDTLIWFTGPKTNNTAIKGVFEVTEDFSYWMGLIVAEGRIAGGVKFYNCDKTLLLKFKKITENTFGVSTEPLKDGLLIRSTALVKFLQFFDIMPMQHSSIKKISKNIMKLDDLCVRAFLRGLFDGDGSVCKNGFIEYATASKELATDVAYLLLRCGIRARLKIKKSWATNSNKKTKRDYWRLRIMDKEDLMMFEDKIGFSQNYKMSRLKQHNNSKTAINTNWDIIPLNGELIRDLRIKIGLSSTAYKDFDLPAIDSYERNERGWSRSTLNKALYGLEVGLSKQISMNNEGLMQLQTQDNCYEIVRALKTICHAPVVWERITDIKAKNEPQWVYDISLEEHFNFIAGHNGGMIAHNTAISVMLAANRLHNYPASKILFLSPTKPLAQQHLTTFKELLTMKEGEMILVTGEVAPEKRINLMKEAKIIFATPQGVENDIINNTLNLKDISLIVFDECHRAVGNYSYVFIAQQYMKKAEFPKILGLTASPGSELEKITEVAANLFIDAVEIRTDSDPDVRPYVQDVDIKKIMITLPKEIIGVKELLERCIKNKMQELTDLGINKKMNYAGKRELLMMQRQLQAQISSGEWDFNAMKALSVIAQAVKCQHGLELVETQSLLSLKKYMDDMFSQCATTKVKATQNLCADVYFKSALIKTESLLAQNIEHPKLEAVSKFIEAEVQKNKEMKIILFTQYRDTAVQIKEMLSKKKDVIPELFVGQSKQKTTGLSQKKQIEMLEQFKDGLFNVLIATSVAEEGLDIPKVDLVAFYEPIPSAIRSIQRRGRTGRNEKGAVVMFITQGTRDEGYYWSSKAKENRMHSTLAAMRTELSRKFIHKPVQPKIDDFDKVLVRADFREKGKGVMHELINMGADIKMDNLDCADYILSSKVGIELKRTDDFVASIIDGRLMEQIKLLKNSFDKPLVIIEGEEDIYNVRNIHPNAIRGMLANIAVNFGIPIIQTKNEKDTAQLLHIIARREQSLDKSPFNPHANKKPMSVKESQEYLISSIPNIGPSLSKEILTAFGTIKNIVNAEDTDLQKVAGVGESKAKAMKDLFDYEYKNKA